jgi:hypothetical protein
MILTIKFQLFYIQLAFSSVYGNVIIFNINKDEFYKSYSECTLKTLEDYVYSKQFESKEFGKIANFLSSVYTTKLIEKGGIEL